MRKISLFLLTVILTASLASCNQGGFRMGTHSLSTYDECISFIDEFKEHGCSDLPRFLFNLDKEDSVIDMHYCAIYVESYDTFPPKQSINYPTGLSFNLYFYMNNNSAENINDRAYKIEAECYHTDFLDDGWSTKYELILKKIHINTVVSENYLLEDGYNYETVCSLQVDDREICSIKICSMQEITDEKIDEICSTFKNNIIIID